MSEDRVLLASLTKACKLNFDIAHPPRLVKKGMINILIRSVGQEFSNQPHLNTLYRTMLAAMYYGLFRIGEITASPHVVKAKDVHVGMNKKKLMFVLFTSKTHSWAVKPQMIKISAISGQKYDRKLCPYKLLQDYVLVRPKYRRNSEPFFIYKDHTAVSLQNFRKVFRSLLERNSFDPTLYSCHGARAGWASDLLDMGVSVEMIRKIGRWKSNAVYAYFKH